MSVPRLKVSNLSKSFGELRVLDELSFDLKGGEILAIIGKSGSGKSTLLKALSLIDYPDSGEVALDGKTYVRRGVPLYEPWEVRRNIALVFQEFNLFPNFTVLGNITLALRENVKLPRDSAVLAAIEVARSLKIEPILDRYPNEISTGQAQRCALARAIVLKPRVFLLDEITSALDPMTIMDVVDAISALRKAPGTDGMSVVLVTHLLQFATNFADRIAFFHAGKIYEEHPAAQFLERANKPETIRFLGAYAGNYDNSAG